MVTVKKFIKMMNASEEKRNEIIDRLSEEDAKDYLKIIMTELYGKSDANGEETIE